MKVIARLKNMSINQKLIAIVATVLTPLIVTSWLLFNQLSMANKVTLSEMDGTRYLVPVRGLLEHVAEHRGLSNGYLNGDASLMTNLQVVASKIREDVAVINQLNKELGGQLESTLKWQSIESDWVSLQGSGGSIDSGSSFQRHTALIKQILLLMIHVGDTSSLILDPELDSFYLMDLIVKKLPLMAENLGTLRGTSTGIAARGSLADGDSFKLTAMTSVIDNNAADINNAVSTAIANNPILSARLQAEDDAFKSAVRGFTRSTQALMLYPDTIDMESQEIFNEGTAAISAAMQLFDKAAPALNELLQARPDKFTIGKYQQVAAIAAMLALVSILSWWIGRLITTQVVHARDVLESISRGNLTA